MDKIFIEIEIAFSDLTYDLIYNRLYLNGLTSFLEENRKIKVYLTRGESAISEKITKELREFDNIPEKCISLSIFNNKDWNNEWEKSIEPVYIFNKLVIYPSWKKDSIKRHNEIIPIQIDPKMSFGTGHNDTTQLILELLCTYIEPEENSYMLDFGCGTGILSIAAIKLGIKNAVAIEIDSDAIENAKENFEVNGVSEYIILYKSNISEINEKGFDIIAANITSNVILPNLGEMYNKLSAGGKLFITGILKEETEEMIINLTKYNFGLKELKQRAEWSAFYAVKQ
ncbi:MAG: 50S ribosomal protein L11 methyltransferase [Ignavibacteria bacterium]|nr:50S ribosomal protein L11 methyltransferase [Ignavibacteria bacterium]